MTSREILEKIMQRYCVSYNKLAKESNTKLVLNL